MKFIREQDIGYQKFVENHTKELTACKYFHLLERFPNLKKTKAAVWAKNSTAKANLSLKLIYMKVAKDLIIDQAYYFVNYE